MVTRAVSRVPTFTVRDRDASSLGNYSSSSIAAGLQPAGLDHWGSGALFNSNDGGDISGLSITPFGHVFLARIYLGVSLFGETKTLLRVPRLRSEGWC